MSFWSLNATPVTSNAGKFSKVVDLPPGYQIDQGWLDFGANEQTEMYLALGLAILLVLLVGLSGLVMSTVLVLFITPAIYRLFIPPRGSGLDPFHISIKHRRHYRIANFNLYPDPIGTRLRECKRKGKLVVRGGRLIAHSMHTVIHPICHGHVGRGLFFLEDFLRRHRNATHRMQMREYGAVVPTDGGVAQHTHVWHEARGLADRVENRKFQGALPRGLCDLRIIPDHAVAAL